MTCMYLGEPEGVEAEGAHLTVSSTSPKVACRGGRPAERRCERVGVRRGGENDVEEEKEGMYGLRASGPRKIREEGKKEGGKEGRREGGREGTYPRSSGLQ